MPANILIDIIVYPCSEVKMLSSWWINDWEETTCLNIRTFLSMPIISLPTIWYMKKQKHNNYHWPIFTNLNVCWVIYKFKSVVGLSVQFTSVKKKSEYNGSTCWTGITFWLVNHMNCQAKISGNLQKKSGEPYRLQVSENSGKPY